MRCLRLNQSFFGWSLQTGTKAIGLVSLFAIIGNLCKGIIGLTWILSLQGQLVLSSQDFLSSTEITAIIQIVGSVIGLAVTVPLLIAATKNSRPHLLLPCLILGVIAFVALIAAFGYLLYVFVLLGQFIGMFAIGSVSVLLVLLTSALGIYCWLVIYSYYKQMKEQLPLNNCTFPVKATTTDSKVVQWSCVNENAQSVAY